jgi:hypothetical protein
VVQIAIDKSIVHDVHPKTGSVVRAFVSARKFGCPANYRARSRSVESPRPGHSFKKT